MAYPKQDIRVTKTHKALAETLLALLEVKTFQKITVNDICQNAMVSRSTFYLHFEDKYQLLLFCLQIQQEELVEARQKTDPREFLHSALATIKEHEKVYRNLLMADINEELLKMFQAVFRDRCAQMLKESEEMGAELAGPIPILAVFYADGLAATVMWWIEHNFQYSVEEMALCQFNLLSEIMPE
ncbi:MAG: TetR/AcrR family transcriptional regulator [Oscillospiraceae bacterium]